jgi:endonuclease/exonuclease/phosphatase family metal-dependent hydrolase
MTEPVCRLSELKGRVALVDTLHRSQPRLVRLVIKTGYVALMALLVLPAMVLSPIAMLVRALFRRHATGLWMTDQTKQMEWAQGSKEQPLRMLTWNVCAPAGQYSITDGGILPWRDRIQKLHEAITEARANIVCLAEVFDAAAALEMAKLLGQTYAHVLMAVGTRAVGVPSGMLVASQGPLEDVQFEAFPKAWLDGRTKNSEKGILQFTVPLPGKKLTVLTSHLQHSEQPAQATDDEKACRQKQFEKIQEVADQALGKDHAVVLTGDLNIEPSELQTLPQNQHLDRGACPESPTWGGDGWCASLAPKPGSGPLVLDYTMSWKGSVQKLNTRYTETGFNGTEFRASALSDHCGLISEIVVA